MVALGKQGDRGRLREREGREGRDGVNAMSTIITRDRM